MAPFQTQKARLVRSAPLSELTKHLEFEMIKLVALYLANRTANDCYYVRLGRYAAEPDLDMIVGKKTLEEFAVAIFPGLRAAGLWPLQLPGCSRRLWPRSNP